MSYTEKDDVRGWWGQTMTVNGKTKVKFNWKVKLLGVLAILGLTFGTHFYAMVEDAVSEVTAQSEVYQVTTATFNEYGRTTVGKAFDSYFDNSTWELDVRPNGSKYVIHSGVLKTDMIFIEAQPRFDIYGDLVAPRGSPVITKFVINRDDTFEIADVELEFSTANFIDRGIEDLYVALTEIVYMQNGYELDTRVNIGNRNDLVNAMLENIYN